MSNLQSINPRARLTPEMIDEIESSFLALCTSKTEVGKVFQEMEAVHLPRIVKGLGLVETDTVKTVSKSQGLHITLETLLQIVCQALDSTTDFCIPEQRELFDMFDADKDGLLESYELQRVLNLMGENIESEGMEKQMKQHDTEYNGENLSFRDWKNILTKLS